MTEFHGIFVYWTCTAIRCLFRVFSVFNFITRNYTELSCTTCTRRHRIDSVCFPCLIFYDGITRNFRLLIMHGNTVFVPLFSVFNFRSRNYTELWCMTYARQHRIDSVSFFPCLIFYDGTSRNFRVLYARAHANRVHSVCVPCGILILWRPSQQA